MGDERLHLRTTFDEAALLYDDVRPGYPEALFHDVVSLSGIPSGGRILEIGCGTGQATVPFARRGYRTPSSRSRRTPSSCWAAHAC